MDRSAVLSYVMTSADNDCLNDIIEAVKFRREKLSKIAKYSLSVGTAVKFTYKGVEFRGIVKTIRVKKAVVECEHPNGPNVNAYNYKLERVPATINYTVPLNMLEAA